MGAAKFFATVSSLAALGEKAERRNKMAIAAQLAATMRNVMTVSFCRLERGPRMG